MKKITTEEFVKRANKIHKDLYNYDKVIYKGNIFPVEIICPIHGSFFQTPHEHLGGCGCQICGGKVEITTEEFIKRAKKVHKYLYSYEKVEYKRNDVKVEIICPIHGSFFQTPSNHLSGHKCYKCALENKKKSNGEAKILTYLIEGNYTFRQNKEFNDLKDKKKLSYDFYLQKENVLIEFNGKQHYQFHNLFQKNYHNFLVQKHHDWLKRKYARDNKMKLIIIPYWEIDNIEKILKEEI